MLRIPLSDLYGGTPFVPDDWPHGLRCGRTDRLIEPGELITFPEAGSLGHGDSPRRVEVIALGALHSFGELAVPASILDVLVVYADAEGAWRWRSLGRHRAVVMESARSFATTHRTVTLGDEPVTVVDRHGRDLAIDDARARPDLFRPLAA